MLIWSFKKKIDPYGCLIKHKSCICSHGGMQQWGVNYWENYSPVVNWISIGVMLILNILRDIHNKSVYFVLVYTKADIESKIFMELPIEFWVEGYHPR